MSTPTIANPPLGKATDFLRNYGAIIGMIIVLLIFYWLKPAFLSPANIANVLRQSTILIILALGLTVVMSMRGVDLSIAQIADAAGLMTDQYFRRSSCVRVPSKPCRTNCVERPVQTTSEKYIETWLKIPMRTRGSCAVAMKATQEPRLVPRTPTLS